MPLWLAPFAILPKIKPSEDMGSAVTTDKIIATVSIPCDGAGLCSICQKPADNVTFTFQLEVQADWTNKAQCALCGESFGIGRYRPGYLLRIAAS
jgi:hypothetical protein